MKINDDDIRRALIGVLTVEHPQSELLDWNRKIGDHSLWEWAISYVQVRPIDCRAQAEGFTKTGEEVTAYVDQCSEVFGCKPTVVAVPGTRILVWLWWPDSSVVHPKKIAMERAPAYEARLGFVPDRFRVLKKNAPELINWESPRRPLVPGGGLDFGDRLQTSCSLQGTQKEGKDKETHIDVFGYDFPSVGKSSVLKLTRCVSCHHVVEAGKGSAVPDKCPACGSLKLSYETGAPADRKPVGQLDNSPEGWARRTNGDADYYGPEDERAKQEEEAAAPAPVGNRDNSAEILEEVMCDMRSLVDRLEAAGQEGVEASATIRSFMAANCTNVGKLEKARKKLREEVTRLEAAIALQKEAEGYVADVGEQVECSSDYKWQGEVTKCSLSHGHEPPHAGASGDLKWTTDEEDDQKIREAHPDYSAIVSEVGKRSDTTKKEFCCVSGEWIPKGTTAWKTPAGLWAKTEHVNPLRVKPTGKPKKKDPKLEARAKFRMLDVKALKALCRDQKLKGFSGMRKAQLVELLTMNETKEEK